MFNFRGFIGVEANKLPQKYQQVEQVERYKFYFNKEGKLIACRDLETKELGQLAKELVKKNWPHCPKCGQEMIVPFYYAVCLPCENKVREHLEKIKEGASRCFIRRSKFSPNCIKELCVRLQDNARKLIYTASDDSGYVGEYIGEIPESGIVELGNYSSSQEQAEDDMRGACIKVLAKF